MKYFLLGAFASRLLPLRHRARSSAPPGRPTSTASPRPSPAAAPDPLLADRASASCWSASASRSPRCPSTSGRPTSTRARPPRSPPSSPPAPRRPPSPRCSACCWWRSAARQVDWAALLWGLAVLSMTVGNVVAHRPAERQAHARVLVDRPRRLHPGGRGRGRRARRRQRALLPARLHVHDRGRLRRRSCSSSARGSEAVGVADYAGLAARHPLLALALDGLPALADRDPADRGLRRQVLPVRGRGARRLRLAGRDRRAQLRGRRLLLPAHHRLHVHARARRRAGRHRVVPRGGLWRSSSRSGASCSSASCPRRSSTWPRPRSPRCCGEGAAGPARPSPMAIALPYRGWLFDLDGTVYLGERLVPGAAEAIAALRAAGRRVALPLQQAARDARGLRREAHAPGHPAAADDVVNSSLVLARHLQRLDPGAPVFVIGEPPMLAEMRAHGFEVRDDEHVRWVVIAFDRTFTYAKLNTALQAVTARRAAHRDQSRPHVPGGGRRDPRLRGDDRGGGGGDRARGSRRSWASPRRSSSRWRSRALGVAAAEAVMVGDRIETDIAMGRRPASPPSSC